MLTKKSQKSDNNPDENNNAFENYNTTSDQLTNALKTKTKSWY